MDKQKFYSDAICDYLKSHPFVSVYAVEIELKLPVSTIAQALNGSRLIPEKHIYNILFLLADYGIQIDEYKLSSEKKDKSISAHRWVKNEKTIKEGKGFAYIVREYRWIAYEYSDLPYHCFFKINV